MESKEAEAEERDVDVVEGESKDAEEDDYAQAKQRAMVRGKKKKESAPVMESVDSKEEEAEYVSEEEMVCNAEEVTEIKKVSDPHSPSKALASSFKELRGFSTTDSSASAATST